MRHFTPQTYYPYSPYQSYYYPPSQQYYIPNKPTPPLTQILDKFNLKGKDLNHTMQQLQQLAKLSQTITPLVQQYGPVIKNIPNMLALLKQFQKQSNEPTLKRPEQTTLASEDNLYKIETIDTQVGSGHSAPKLYV
ncbi:YqfQ-like protein [Pelagirhabdus alkalitolerans]|uniref:YqfQ-like protein n=1 Tax=Pelagirhabdus alkalitolerans TaxID=1612202 RepID=A0A1G6HA39_9BACI|nr:VrrA/YqfQ family protein [Pelagirhabdus alkalitolerans]SDB90795.1 YqfQ-like protein [Pelagirhabdus alkalitolerans]